MNQSSCRSTPRPRLALLESDLVWGHSELFGCLLAGLSLTAPAHPVPAIRVLPQGRVNIQKNISALLVSNPQILETSHLPWWYSRIMDSDKVGWDAVAPPQLPGDAPVPAERGWPERSAQPVPAQPSLPPATLSSLTHRILSIQACHVR